MISARINKSPVISIKYRVRPYVAGAGNIHSFGCLCCRLNQAILNATRGGYSGINRQLSSVGSNRAMSMEHRFISFEIR